MSLHRRCDICRAEIPHGEGRALLTRALLDVPSGTSTESHDLCESCWNSIKDFIIGLKRQQRER